MKQKLALFWLLTWMLFTASVQSQDAPGGRYQLSAEKAKQLVDEVLRSSPVIDGHNDLFAWYFGCQYKRLPKCPQGIGDYPLDTVSKGQTDIPRWRKGGVGGAQLNVYSDSLSSFLDAYDLLYELEKTYSRDLEVVADSRQMRSAIKQGKIALLPMLEGSERLEGSLAILRNFYRLGLRCVTFTYSTGLLADGSEDEPRYHGISPLGRTMVEEMNRLGIIIDLSHASTQTMSDMLRISRAPVIFSHSNARRLCNVSRNVPDDILLRLKSAGGLIMVDMVPDHTKQEFADWVKAGDSVYSLAKQQFPDDRKKLKEIISTWESLHPKPIVSISDIADHFDYLKKLIGVGYVGIGGDYDGLDYTINGMEDVSCYPKLLLELARRGWSKNELRKISGENYLRVFEAIEKKAAAIRNTGGR